MGVSYQIRTSRCITPISKTMALLAGLVALVAIPRAWGAEQGRLVLKVAVTDETGGSPWRKDKAVE